MKDLVASVTLVPAERDASAARMYRFMRWFIRKHRKEIQTSAENAVFMMMAYGTVNLTKLQEEFENSVNPERMK